MASESVSASVEAAHADLAALSPEQEVEILDRILIGGYDQGCFIREPDEALLDLSPHGLGVLIESLVDREPVDASKADPFEGIDIPETPIEGIDHGQVVLTQRCDLVRCLRDEPIVEVARATLVQEGPVVSSAKMNSPRVIHLCDCDDGAWIVDLRARGQLLKPRLLEHEVVLPVTAGRPRRDLALRLGRRYSRDAIPGDIVRDFQTPLTSWIKDKKARRRKAEQFSEFLVSRQPDGSLLFMGVIGEGHDRAAADAAFKEIVAGIRGKVSMEIAPESGTYTSRDIPLGLWKDAYKLDLDRLTRSSKASDQAAEPNR